LYAEGKCDHICLIALRSATAEDTVDLGRRFSLIKHAAMVSVTGTHIAVVDVPEDSLRGGPLSPQTAGSGSSATATPQAAEATCRDRVFGPPLRTERGGSRVGGCEHVGQIAEAHAAALCGNFCYPGGPTVLHTFVVGITWAAAQTDVHCVASSYRPPQ